MNYDTAYAIWKGSVGATEPEYMEMNRLISIALLKQKPKKPIIKDYVANCPECGVLLKYDVYCEKSMRIVEITGDNYCPHCGQAIDWSDKDE